jgi:hypothetical protein
MLRQIKKKYFGLIIFLCVFGICLSPLTIYAQTDEPKIQQDESLEQDEPDIEFEEPEVIDECENEMQSLEMQRDCFYKKHPKIEGAGAIPGRNGKFYVAFGQAVIQPYNTNQMIQARQVAFTRAMLDARREMVDLLGVELEAEQEYIMSQPEKGRAEAARQKQIADIIGIEEKKNAANAAQVDIEKKGAKYGATVLNATAKGVNRIYQNELNQQLKANGVDITQPVDPAQVKAVLNSRSFLEKTSAVAINQSVGMQAYKTFEFLGEKEGKIGVIAIYSPKLKAIANSILGGDPGLIPPGAPKSPIRDQIPAKKERIMTFGVQMKINENGLPALLSFYQTGQIGNLGERAAKRKVKIGAMSQIHKYAGMTLLSETQNKDALNIDEFDDLSMDVEINSDLNDRIKAVAKKAKISGISTLKTWSADHPKTGHKIHGIVMSWSPSSKAMAEAFDRQVNAPIIKARKSRKQNRNPDRNPAVKNGRQPLDGNFSGSGASASDDF